MPITSSKFNEAINKSIVYVDMNITLDFEILEIGDYIAIKDLELHHLLIERFDWRLNNIWKYKDVKLHPILATENLLDLSGIDKLQRITYNYPSTKKSPLTTVNILHYVHEYQHIMNIHKIHKREGITEFKFPTEYEIQEI